MHFEVPNVTGAEIQITTNGRTKTLDDDGILIARVADKDSQTITVVASADGYDDVTKVYSLSGLMCEEEDDLNNDVQEPANP